MEESNNQLVTIDVGAPEEGGGNGNHGGGGTTTKLRSIHSCSDTVDVALFTDPEEIYLMKVSIEQSVFKVAERFININAASLSII